VTKFDGPRLYETCFRCLPSCQIQLGLNSQPPRSVCHSEPHDKELALLLLSLDPVTISSTEHKRSDRLRTRNKCSRQVVGHSGACQFVQKRSYIQGSLLALLPPGTQFVMMMVVIMPTSVVTMPTILGQFPYNVTDRQPYSSLTLLTRVTFDRSERCGRD